MSTEFGGERPSNSNKFQHFDGSLFTPNNVEHENHMNFQDSPDLQQFQKQQVMIAKHSFCTSGLDLACSSSSTSPIPSQFSQNSIKLSGSFSQNSPEKVNASQPPPSPADSGVVEDSKSEVGNTSQESSQCFDQNKSDDVSSLNCNFNGNPVESESFMALGTIIPEANYEDSRQSGFQEKEVLSSAMNSLSLSASTSKMNSKAALGFNLSKDYGNNNGVSSQDLSAIWSSPTTAFPNTSTSSPSLDDIMLQTLQQQHSSGWNNPLQNRSKPPPGLQNNVLLQNQLQQQETAAKIQALQHQLAIERALSAQPSLSRSTSCQPGHFTGLENLNQPKMSGILPGLKSSPSFWGNSQARPSNAWPSTNRGSSSLFNSLQQSSSNRVLNGSNMFSKPLLASHAPHPPRLSRSISTPAKYPSYFHGSGTSAPLDDHSLLNMDDYSLRSGLASLESRDHFTSNLEAQLLDLMRSDVSSSHGIPRSSGKWPDMNGDLLFGEQSFGQMTPSMANGATSLLAGLSGERFSRKVFVGGLPPDIDENEIQASFRQFGYVTVDWPHKAESKSYFPPKGYAFLLFQEELSVHHLVSCCHKDGDKLYLPVSSPTIREKPVQIRPWNLSDSDFVLDGSQPLDPRKTIFVGGVPRPLRAVELAMIMDRLYGGVCYAGIDVDPELKYPKGAGRVAFSNQQSYIAAINARFVQLQHGDIDKRVEIKPYVLDDQHCDECHGSRCGGKFAPFFCGNITCLQYYCEHCWTLVHAISGKQFHKPLVKEGADRSSRSMTLRW